jgi:hypothetical protein
MSGDWLCRELGEDDLGGVLNVAREAPLSQTVHLQAALDAPTGSGRWWFAAINNGGVGAFAAVEGTRASLFATDTSAVEAMARAMLRSQLLHTSREAHRHVLFGEAAVVDPFWQIFVAVNRQVVADRRLQLMAGTEPGKGSSRMELVVAKQAELPVCLLLLAEQATEEHGQDPRRTAPQAFERSVAEALAQGRLILGREGGRPMFVAESVALDAGTALLRRVYVPVPYRSRKLLVGGALHAARELGAGSGRQVWAFVDGGPIHLAATRAGYGALGAWREIAMLG